MTQATIARLGLRANTRATGRTIPLDLLIVGGILALVFLALLIFGTNHAANIDARALTGLGR
jgi:hypothetical protein